MRRHLTDFTTARYKTLKSVAIVGLSSLFLTACIHNLDMNVPRFADGASLKVSEDTLKSVNRVLYASFTYGEWRYQGVHAQAGKINAYIKMPDALQMPEDVQRRYVSEVICPSADNADLWYRLKHIDLAIHLYTDKKSNSVSATCNSPYHA